MRFCVVLIGCFLCFVGGTFNGMSHWWSTIVGLLVFLVGFVSVLLSREEV